MAIKTRLQIFHAKDSKTLSKRVNNWLDQIGPNVIKIIHYEISYVEREPYVHVVYTFRSGYLGAIKEIEKTVQHY